MHRERKKEAGEVRARNCYLTLCHAFRLSLLFQGKLTIFDNPLFANITPVGVSLQ